MIKWGKQEKMWDRFPFLVALMSYENMELSKEITRNSKIMDIRSNAYVNEHRA